MRHAALAQIALGRVRYADEVEIVFVRDETQIGKRVFHLFSAEEGDAALDDMRNLGAQQSLLDGS